LLREAPRLPLEACTMPTNCWSEVSCSHPRFEGAEGMFGGLPASSGILAYLRRLRTEPVSDEPSDT
jgi:hypothetical protein